MNCPVFYKNREIQKYLPGYTYTVGRGICFYKWLSLMAGSFGGKIKNTEIYL